MTIVNVDLTHLPLESRSTGAGEVINHIGACTAVETRIGGALVVINFAVLTRVAGRTGACIGAGSIGAVAPILAWSGQTLVDVHITVFAVEARDAVALESASPVNADTIVTGFSFFALVNVSLTESPTITFATFTREVGRFIPTHGPVHALAGRTVVDLHGTIFSRPAHRTLTKIRSDEINAHLSRTTGHVEAVIDVCLASRTRISWCTATGEEI